MKNVVNVASSISQIDILEKMAMFRRELSVKQIEKLEKMAMFRREHWPKKKKINSLGKCWNIDRKVIIDWFCKKWEEEQ